MRRKDLTCEQKDWLVRNFANTPKRDLSSRLGISIPTLYRLAHDLQLETPGRPVNKISLTDEQLNWIIRKFPTTENEYMAYRLGVSESTLHRIARKYGLSKSKSFMTSKRIEAGHASIYMHKVRDDGFIPKKGDPLRPGSERGQFKAGEKPIDRLGAKREAERVRKSAKSLADIRAAEKMRIMRGLPRKTKMRIRTVPPQTYAERYYLRKRGYTLDDAALVAYWTPETRRAVRMEARPRVYKFLPSV